MKYTIKRNNKDIATVSPTGSLNCKIMAEEVVQMQFVLPEYIAFKIGDTVSVYGTTYVLNQEPSVQKISTINYAFELQFESFKYDLNKVLCLGLNSKNELTEPDYAIMGDPMMLLKHLVANANRLGGNWKVGEAEKLEPKNISFSNHNVLSALSMCAEEFETEYWVDGNKTIHLIKKQSVSGLSLKYGMSQGLRTISRTTLDSSNVLTRLYAQGSTQNIPVKYRYGSSRLKMDVPFLEKNVDKFGLIEFSKTFEDIYPRRNGKVTAVFADDPFRFVDSSQDFDLNGKTSIHGEEQPILLPGVSAKVTFNTGQLAGYTFEIKKNGYDHSKKSFVLLKNKDEKAYEVPNNLLRPAVGDQYVLTEIVMPEVYITNAEVELKKKAQDYVNENSVPRLQYAVQSDPIYFENQNINLQLGNTIKFVDADFGLDANIRVVSISKDLQNPYQVEFSIAEQMQQQKIVRDYIEKNKKEQEIRESSKKFNQDIQRNYEFSQEINENVFDAEGYFDPQKIKPLSIETKMLSVGSREQQFTLEDLTFMVEGNNTALRNTKGQIVHYSLEDKPRTWSIPANTLNGISTGFNFIYIKAQKVGNNASVFVSPNQIKVDQDAAFYHFEAGYLSSISDGLRKIRLSNGFTSINGREITTGRISSQDGKTFIDLDTGEMRGKMTFTDDSPALGQIDEKINAIEVGGRNLMLNSSKVTLRMDANNIVRPEKDGITRLFPVKGASNYWQVVNELTTLGDSLKNKPVTITMRLAGHNLSMLTKKGFEKIEGLRNDASYYVIVQIKTSGLQYVDSVSGTAWRYPCFFLRDDSWMYLDWMKIEEGHSIKSKDWNPALEDIENSIQDQEVYYEYSQDGQSNWHIPPLQSIDNYQRLKKGNGVWSVPVRITGVPGEKGKDGVQLYTWIRYSDSPTSGISASPVNKNYVGYAYNKTSITPSNIYSDYDWQLTKGNTGDKGTPGAKGQDGIQLYNWIRYADSPTSGISSSPVGKSYMGIAVNKTSITPSSIYSDYDWQLTKGNTGEQGVPGKAGVDGRTPFTHTAYANSIDGKKDFHLSDSTNRSFWGTYTDYTIQDSNDPSKYKWIKVRGDAITSRTEPVNKYEGMLWIDSSKSPFEQKVWNGTKWELVGLSIDNIEFGSRNLMLNSSKVTLRMDANNIVRPEKDGITRLFPVKGASNYWQVVNELTTLGDSLKNKPVTITMRLAGHNLSMLTKKGFEKIEGLRNDASYYTIVQIKTSGLQYVDNVSGHAWGYPMFFLSADSWMYLDWIKIEEGHSIKSKDWTPAIEDTQAELDALNLLTSQQRQELDTVKRTTDKLNQVTSYLTTTVDGGVVTTSTLQVGATTTNASGQTVSKAKAGITGVASSNVANINLDRRVVFWASTGFAQRENALFQVWDDGYVVMEKARVKGHIEGESGWIKNMSADNLTVTNGFFKGRIESTEGKIASFELKGDYITSSYSFNSVERTTMSLGRGNLEVRYYVNDNVMAYMETNNRMTGLGVSHILKLGGENPNGFSVDGMAIGVDGTALNVSGNVALRAKGAIHIQDNNGGSGVGVSRNIMIDGKYYRFINGILVG
ncbi:phage tail protein [Myroides odoratimimus]|uniref:phage tail protein n=1 Tax=Myroides odoratimimus TaxID=76832 RepID=UPI0025756F76|nr:phage tail protein [Myroides odoratimimus]MDM1093426.1 phage tail protein [Myroides odoratimimus]